MASITPITKLTYQDYVCYPDDGKRHEIIDGDHYMNPAPVPLHQSVLQRLQVQLFNGVELTGLGRVFPAPIDVQLSDHDIVQPDIVVVAEARLKIITPIKIKGSPDLVVEVLSASTAKNDQQLKRQIYQRAGVGEYWIVDSQKRTLLQLILRDGQYAEQPHDDAVALSVIANVSVELSPVW